MHIRYEDCAAPANDERLCIPPMDALPPRGEAPREAELGVTQGESDKVLSLQGPDTVHLSWGEGSFRVLSSSSLVVSEGTPIGTAESVSEPFLVTEDGEVIDGYYARFTDPLGRYKASVRRDWSGRTRLVVEFSAAFGSGDNLYLPSAACFRSRWEQVRQSLEAAGILVAAEDGSVERLDVAENHSVPRPASDYIGPLHRYVQPGRWLKDATEPAYRESVWWKNGSRQLQMYVKRPEVIRVEWRAMGKNSVARHFSVSSLVGLLDGVDGAVCKAREMTRGVLPLREVPAEYGGFESLFRAADPGSNACVRNALYALAKLYLREHGGEADLVQALREVKDGRAARGLEEDLDEAEPLLGAWDEAGRQDLVLYDEFRTLALAA